MPLEICPNQSILEQQRVYNQVFFQKLNLEKALLRTFPKDIDAMLEVDLDSCSSDWVKIWLRNLSDKEELRLATNRALQWMRNIGFEITFQKPQYGGLVAKGVACKNDNDRVYLDLHNGNYGKCNIKEVRKRPLHIHYEVECLEDV